MIIENMKIDIYTLIKKNQNQLVTSNFSPNINA